MFSRNSKLFGLLVLVAALTVVVPAFAAGKSKNIIPVRATVIEFCANCMTDVGGVFAPWVALPIDWLAGMPSYSMKTDGLGDYVPVVDSSGVSIVISDWGTNSAVYSLNTENSLVNGLVNLSGGTRAVRMHFFSTVEFPFVTTFPGDTLPPCWSGSHNHIEAVNWDVFASQFIERLAVGDVDHGTARANFNVRPDPADYVSSTCDQQNARFVLTWSSVCIVRLPDVGGKRVWVATSDLCEGTTSGLTPGGSSSGLNFGTASLQGFGGRHGQTIPYGDWRMPFKLILNEM